MEHLIFSVGTARSFQQCTKDFLEWRLAAGIGVDAVPCRLEIEDYLAQESKRWRQKTLDQHRQALALVFSVALTTFDADIPTFVDGRAYTPEEVNAIADRQSPKHRLATAPLVRLPCCRGLSAATRFADCRPSR
jgi:hypothetical protein